MDINKNIKSKLSVHDHVKQSYLNILDVIKHLRREK